MKPIIISEEEWEQIMRRLANGPIKTNQGTTSHASWLKLQKARQRRIQYAINHHNTNDI